MKLVVLIAAVVLASNSAFAQDIDCPPRMPKSLTTTRVPQSDAAGIQSILTVSEGDVGDRQVVAVYQRPLGDFVGPFSLNGDIDWTNNTAVRRRMSIRLIVQLADGIVPIIPEIYSGEVCWEPSTKRIISTYSQVVDAGQNIEVPVMWEIVTRLEGQLADFNGDGWVDELDQTLLIDALGTDNPLYDLNMDGIVDMMDMELLFQAISESWEDQIEANAGGGGVEEDPIEPPVEVVDVDFNPLWESADEIIILTLNELPTDTTRAGHFILPKVQWRLM
mgnify:FL=1|jgi:hypothetical protein